MQGNAKITAKQQSAITLLLDGKSHVDVAEHVGINEATLWRWQQSPDFNAAYNEARKLQLDHAFSVLQGKFERAVAVLDEHLSSLQARDAIKAAEIIIDRSIKLAALTERIAELEAENERLRTEQEHSQYCVTFDLRELSPEQREILRAINESLESQSL